MRNRLSVIIAIFVFVVFGFFFFAKPQEAQITIPIVVGNTSDTVVAGACIQGSNVADCSLRGAILQANAGSTNSIIRFQIPASNPFCSAGVCTINLASALPAITEPLSIVGSGADKLIVKPATGVNTRIFHVTAATTVSISDITIRDGKVLNGDVDGAGAGILKTGAGILNVTNAMLSNNTADITGGGIYSGAGTVNITNSILTNNRAGANGGFGSGGGIIAAASVVLNVTNSTITANTTNNDGGGIANFGTANITNSTVSWNAASGAFPGDTNIGGGIFSSAGATTNVKSSIIAVNSAANTGPDVRGDFVSAGFNLIGKVDGGGGFTAPTDQIGLVVAPLDPMLDPGSPGLNGGPTRTFALMPGSPAIDKGTRNGLTGSLTTDQRGGVFRRNFDSSAIPNAAGGDGTDIGAFELQVRSPADLDGDNRTDVGIFRPSVGEWWSYRSLTGTTFATQFGQSTDRITPGDFTGDGKADIAFWRPSNGFWFILRSENSTFFSFPFGTSGDVPAPADFDFGGVTDEAVFRPSTGTWFYRQSFDESVIIVSFGANGDVPVPGDYDGDGAADIAIYRPSAGQWWINRSTGGVFATTFGGSSDKPVQGDYTGDGKTDIAFWRPSTGQWFVLRSEDFSFFSFTFGTNGDIPAPGDYDGDGKFDATIFRPSTATWFSNRTNFGTLIQQFGINGDRPIPSAFVP